MNKPINIFAPYGFSIIYSVFSGICVYVKDNPIDKGYNYQINTECFSVIDNNTTDIIFSINGIDPTTHPMAKYSKTYKNLNDLIKNEPLLKNTNP